DIGARAGAAHEQAIYDNPQMRAWETMRRRQAEEAETEAEIEEEFEEDVETGRASRSMSGRTPAFPWLRTLLWRRLATQGPVQRRTHGGGWPMRRARPERPAPPRCFESGRAPVVVASPSE